MEAFLLKLLESGGPLGVLVAVIIIAICVTLYFRAKGVVEVRSEKKDDNGRLDEVAIKVTDIDRRLQHVEQDLRQRPTRDDMHQIEIAVVRLEETVNGVSKTAEATRQSVTRIENYLLEYGKSNHV